MAVNYFKKIGARRLLIMIMGNVFLGMGISIFKLSGLGNDPFSGMVMALANILGFSLSLIHISSHVQSCCRSHLPRTYLR